jgi:sugar phosphate isomerase/epimerase
LPLGQGAIDFQSILDELGRGRYEGWITVELDEYAGAPVDAAKESKKYLAALLAR